MPKFLRRKIRTLTYGYFWWLDYVYAGFWQLRGHVYRGKAHAYLNPRGTECKPPVIIIPGIYERWQFMKPLAKAVYKQGYPVHVIEGLEYNRGKIGPMADVVQTYVRKHDLKGCIIVAHSKGGLIGKHLMVQHEKDGMFNGMIAINTPFTGSKYAQFMLLPSLRMFMPGAPVLRLLAKNQRVNRRIVSIYASFDPHIPGGSFLEGAKNIQLATYGHFRILKDRRLHREVAASLQAML